ncbi:DUF4190 and DUF4352 domain-containing protein [Streptomyces sp. ISL-36]|uniref:DUF4190 domain-containing protein n=1 Tax=Streptomyces sp. ISL-36 TaxID=2819182 RepID=UPI001BE59491|nr:DUF4190 domain-containing protein [Streptomyces sp. ISL-36]MBT2445092.1 DUF4190 and DUF4352 domain-containing protein [Streptomyces sp. ISL-36]
MTTPTNPLGQNPWGPPPTGMPGMPQPPFPQQARNGLGVAALVVGIVGLVFGIIPFLFWLGGILGVLALIFGIIGHGRARKGEATNKGAALTGIILGAVTIVVSLVWLIVIVTAVKDVANDMEDEVRKQQKASTAPAEPGAGAPDDEPTEAGPATLTFGATHTYEDGVKVTVSKPRPYTPDEFAAGHDKGNHAFQVTITIVNGSKKAIDITTALPDARDAEGAQAEQIFDGSGASEPFTGTLLPGKQAKSSFAYSLPAAADKEMQLEVGPKVLDYEHAIWTGPTT